ncbi:SHOCT domain-containing protein [Pelagibacteraceae bacterium]|jgi:hypothetical protein|nr:SHOCT domain-containing protein [Pelagibacteraceae bacterium]
MKKFLWILFLSINLILLNFCAKPTVVDIVLPSDSKLNCKELENEIIQTQKIKREAEYAKEGTGGNVTRVMLFWPAWAQTLHNADIAIKAANDRTYHLLKIIRQKKCSNADKIKNEALNSSFSISNELKDLKDLYDSGDLTKEEYTKAKKKLLD